MGRLGQFIRWWRRVPLGGELDDAVCSVAVLIDDQPAFRAKAKDVAEWFGPSVISKLRRRFHRPVEAPSDFTMRERGLTAWMSYWQFVIFEIVYHFREQALPMLRKVAFGEYDWTQANAIEVMCRLAAEGVDRDRTLADLKRKMPQMREEALEYAAVSLLELAATAPDVATIVAELRQVEEFDTAVRTVREALESDSREGT